ncbi:antibiotic biosynthesis monooxygenase [Brucella sp. 6810]|uniref:Antibiotic biosynthesis monooxygenase n=1 Tax=Brucella inopinata TaxID=1218315 RepID=A0AAW7B9A1_9HYPH|nr:MULTISPECIES: antibiotic biosynthesis monooxygenase [Brucella]KEY05269.1 antibiotic biosynthesis monooxygenase [Brucella suis bv. 4 str. 40]EFM56519.1 antibiotic biosynthesis monooxygenase [Brucella inopinata BO1]MDL2333841.1 antibiotic biosynthesis monooxygenase [Brucella inopinata]MRN42838.1 antibiotic biosynthesis monooxygenase [Brucella sp. 09RB8913]MRN57980.1 antibiotic biosynthesis monooxygenase [Brucella sp. 09RB8918]
MFVNIVKLPEIVEGKEEEFRQWFAESNKEFAKFPGFIRRDLLQPQNGGNYFSILEHESKETFLKMHTSPVQAAFKARVSSLLKGEPSPSFFEIVNI